MRKIPTLFKRDFSKNGEIYDEYSPGTEWVVKGEGVATRKYDGTSVLIRSGKMYKRCELKQGHTAPTDFEVADHDEVTGKTVGWVQVGWGSEDKWHREAVEGGNPDKVDLPDGTYELVGPKVQGNPEQVEKHELWPHSEAERLAIDSVTFDALKMTLESLDIEGIVWHHPDGRMVKIKKKDYGLKR
jgi:hypothetical protein